MKVATNPIRSETFAGLKVASNTLMMRLGPDVWGSHPALVEIFLFKISVQSVPALIVHFSQVRNAAFVELRHARETDIQIII